MSSQLEDTRARAPVEAALKESHRDLYAYLVRRLGDPHDAADVLQEFFVAVLGNFDRVRDEERIRGWMSRILQNSIADHYRKKSRARRLEASYAADRSMIEEDEIDLVICACLYKLLPTLKPDYATLIWRADLLGEERGVLAAELGLDDNAFRVKLHRARRALRRRLHESCETCPEHGYLRCDCAHASAARARLETMAQV